MNKKDYILNKNKYPFHYHSFWFIVIDNKVMEILDFDYIVYMLERHVGWHWEIQKYYARKFFTDKADLYRISL